MTLLMGQGPDCREHHSPLTDRVYCDTCGEIFDWFGSARPPCPNATVETDARKRKQETSDVRNGRVPCL